MPLTEAQTEGRFGDANMTEAQTEGGFGGANMIDAQIDSSASATAGHSLGTAKEDKFEHNRRPALFCRGHHTLLGDRKPAACMHPAGILEFAWCEPERCAGVGVHHLCCLLLLWSRQGG